MSRLRIQSDDEEDKAPSAPSPAAKPIQNVSPGKLKPVVEVPRSRGRAMAVWSSDDEDSKELQPVDFLSSGRKMVTKEAQASTGIKRVSPLQDLEESHGTTQGTRTKLRKNAKSQGNAYQEISGDSEDSDNDEDAYVLTARRTTRRSRQVESEEANSAGRFSLANLMKARKQQEQVGMRMQQIEEVLHGRVRSTQGLMNIHSLFSMVGSQGALRRGKRQMPLTMIKCWKRIHLKEIK